MDGLIQEEIARLMQRRYKLLSIGTEILDHYTMNDIVNNRIRGKNLLFQDWVIGLSFDMVPDSGKTFCCYS